MSDILTGTPPDLTYANDLVRQAWMVVWAITSGALVVILGWMGLSFIMAEHLGTRQAGWREMVPRLVLGLVAAASSLWWCALVLDVADAVSGFIAVSLNVTAGDMLRLDASHPDDGGGGRERGHGPPAGRPLPGLRLLRPLRHRPDGAAPRPHRPPAGPGPDRFGALDSAPHGGLGPQLAAPVHDDGVPAGHPAHRVGAWIRLPEGVRRHRRLRAGAGPDLEAPDVPVLRLHGDPRPVDARQSRHLRLLALDALLRHEPALVADAVGPDHRAGRWRRGGRSGRHGGGSGGGQRGRFGRRQRPQLGGPRWPPHRLAGETAAASPGAAGSSPTTRQQRNGAEETRACERHDGGPAMCR